MKLKICDAARSPAARVGAEPVQFFFEEALNQLPVNRLVLREQRGHGEGEVRGQ